MFDSGSFVFGFIMGGGVVFLVFLIFLTRKEDKMCDLRSKVRNYESLIENLHERKKQIKSI